MYQVYVLYNQIIDKIYIGQTNNLSRRINEHNKKFGNHFTSKFLGEWELIYEESLPTRFEAIKRERQLKTAKGREFVKNYIPG